MLTKNLKKLGTVHFDVQPADRPVWKSKRLKIVTDEWECWWNYKDKMRKLECWPGYIYDGASVPQFAWTLTGLRPDGIIRAASLGHDIPYRHDFDLEGLTKITDMRTGEIVTDMTREEADWFFFMAMVHAGMNNTRAAVAYRAVRIGGKKHWGGPPPYGMND